MRLRRLFLPWPMVTLKKATGSRGDGTRHPPKQAATFGYQINEFALWRLWLSKHQPAASTSPAPASELGVAAAGFFALFAKAVVVARLGACLVPEEQKRFSGMADGRGPRFGKGGRGDRE